LQITKKLVSELKHAPYNPRISVKDNPEFYKKLSNSIEKWGYNLSNYHFSSIDKNQILNNLVNPKSGEFILKCAFNSIKYEQINA